MIGNDNIEAATMDETSVSTSPLPIAEAVPLVEPMRPDRRRHAREIFSQQCSRLDQLEGELSDRLQQLADEIAREMATDNTDEAAAVVEAAHEARLTALSDQIERLRGELASREEALGQLSTDLEQLRVERGSLEQELHVQQSLAAEAQQCSEQTRIELASLGEQLAAAQSQAAATHKRQEELRQQSEAQQQAWEEEREKVQAQSRREARELKSQFADQTEQLKQHQSEIARLHDALARSETEQERLLGQLSESSGPRADEAQELHALRQERDGLSQRLNAALQKITDHDRLSDELQAAQANVEKLKEQLQSRDTIIGELQSDIEQHQADAAGSARTLSESHTQLSAAREQLRGMEELAGDFEQERIKSGRLEQELRVRDALVAEWQTRDEQAQVEIANSAREAANAQSELAAAHERLAELETLASDAEQVRAQLVKLQPAIAQHEAAAAESQQREQRNRTELAAAVEKLQDAEAQLAQARQLQEELRKQAAAERESFLAGQQKHADQRRRIARQYRSRHAEHIKQREAGAAEVEQMRQELAAAQAEQKRLANELNDRDAVQSGELDTLHELRARNEELTTKLATAEAQLAELARQPAELQQAQGELESLRSKLAKREEQLAAARRASEELEAAHVDAGKQQQELRIREALLAEAQSQQEQSRIELAAAREDLNEAQAQLAIARQRQEELRHEAADAHSAAANAEVSGAADHDAELSRLHEALQAAHTQNEQLAAQLRDAPSGDESDELKKLRGERDKLRSKLSEAEEKLAAGLQDADAAGAHEDLQRRCEMAIEELRELKRTNAELETKLKSKGAGSVAAVGGGGALDWEAQKQRLLASLEADDVDPDDEEAVAERQSLEHAIQVTDQVVAEKDAEIEELRRQLEVGGTNNDSAGEAAISELLDHDEIIRAEREKLAQAQAEWREKIGKAEIDISVERAKIARDRMELEERFRTYQDEHPVDTGETTSNQSGKPVRGRWLARLGLKDLNEE